LSDRLSRRNEAVAESIGMNSDSISYSFRVTADGVVERGFITPNPFAGL
jgi:Tfp pilus assembly protein PilX